MLISLNWLRDFVDLPHDLDPKALAERFTVTTAEVEGVTQVQVEAQGLIAARAMKVTELPGTRNLHLVELDVGGSTVETVTAAPVIHEGLGVVYAPPGASVRALGQVGTNTVAGRESVGMILPGDALGIELAAQEAVFLGPELAPGTPLDPALFEDWVIEVDNKSITHRPDLWGHRGIAREMAAIHEVPLRAYPVVPLEELTASDLPSVPIEIAEPEACRRYSGLVLENVPTRPAPLWMQLRLGRVGLRPISALVDLTNYVMLDLGQPMHAFDRAMVDRIEVAYAKEGEVFRTLDGVDRALNAKTLMIQCGGKSIALAGVMGGLETEVAEQTQTLLLESANFDSATVRRTAVGLGLRTDASARFEKSLDPLHTVLAIQRFLHLARECYPDMKLVSQLSDAYPNPYPELSVRLRRGHVQRVVGRDVPDDEVVRRLAPLGFEVTPTDSELTVKVPTFRATGDIRLEVDVIEELARMMGYATIGEDMPHATMRRFEVNRLHELSRRTLEHFCFTEQFNEIHGYLWYDAPWIEQLGYDPGPSVELANPAAAGLHRLRHTLVPGLLASIDKNRFHFDTLRILELGNVYEAGGGAAGNGGSGANGGGDQEFLHVGLVRAQHAKRADDELYHGLKGMIERWAWHRFGQAATFAAAEADAGRPWEDPNWTAEVRIADRVAGRMSMIDRALKQRMDEHLLPWSIVWAELRLSGLEALDALTESLGKIPPYPQVEMDFSLLVPQQVRYEAVAGKLREFRHPLLVRTAFVDRYEGSSIGKDQRSLTFRTVLGDRSRTLVEDDMTAFRQAFEQHLQACGYETRR
jgi:phenylalanyl-tRNA synthetase beta chain